MQNDKNDSVNKVYLPDDVFIRIYLFQPTENSVWLPILCICRLIFIPGFLLCNKASTHYIPTLFNHDGYPITLVILFGLSNGYLGTLCMMFGPR